MDINEIRGLSDTDLQAALVDAKQELWKVRFDLATRQEKNYSRLPATRQRIARILTVMTERRRGDGNAHVNGVDGTAESHAEGAVATATVAAPAAPRRRTGTRAAANVAEEAPAATAAEPTDSADDAENTAEKSD